VLDDGDHPVGHEPAGPDHLAAPGNLGDLDHPASGGDLDPPPRAGGLDLEPLDATSGVDHDLHPVTLHRAILAGAVDPGTRPRGASRDDGVWRILGAGKDLATEGGDMKKFLILLGIIGLVIAVTMYLRNRQVDSEF
jgi:hypothetical protein